MKFPLVKDIDTQSVISVNVTSTIDHALETMLTNNHRNVIVLDNGEFKVLTVHDILNYKRFHTNLHVELSNLKLKDVPTIQKNKNVLETLKFLDESFEYICVIDEKKELHGLITYTDIMSNIDPDTLMDNFRLSDFLKNGRRMKWVSPDVLTKELLDDMLKNEFDNAVIVEEMKPIGIITTKDIMKILKQENDIALPIENFMSKPVETISKNVTIKEALKFVKAKHFKRAVVVDDEGKLTGIISQKELITLTYSRWATLMKEYHEELSEINSKLQEENKEFEALASIDSLTGLYNRHKFSELYITEYTAMTQRHNDMSVLLIDIDHFKNVNDRYGHNVGDYVLRQLSHALLKTVRDVDVVSRWGGEEFVVLLPTVSLQQASKIAENMRAYIANMQLEKVENISISIGISQVIEGDSMEMVIERADSALYLAKNNGRNCVKTQEDL